MHGTLPMLALIATLVRPSLAIVGCSTNSCKFKQSVTVVRGSFGNSDKKHDWGGLCSGCCVGLPFVGCAVDCQDTPACYRDDPDPQAKVYLVENCAPSHLHGALLIGTTREDNEGMNPTFDNVYAGERAVSTFGRGCTHIAVYDHDSGVNSWDGHEHMKNFQYAAPSGIYSWSTSVYGSKAGPGGELQISSGDARLWIKLQTWVSQCDGGFTHVQNTWCRAHLQTKDKIPDMTNGQEDCGSTTHSATCGSPYEVSLVGSFGAAFRDATGQTYPLANGASGFFEVTEVSSSDTAIAAANMKSGSKRIVEIHPQHGRSGTITVTVTARVNGLATVSSAFKATIAAVDDAPYYHIPATATLTEDQALATVDLAGVVTDVDNSDASIAYKLHPAPPAATAALFETFTLSADGKLKLKPALHKFTTSAVQIGVRATSNGKHVDFSVPVTIKHVDDPIKVENAVATVRVQEDSAGETINVHETFSDVEDGVGTISAKDDGSGLVTSTVLTNPFRLRLAFAPNRFGDATVVLTATSGNGGKTSATHTIKVEVAPVDDPPVSKGAPAKRTYAEDSGPHRIDISDWFTDSDGGGACATFAEQHCAAGLRVDGSRNCGGAACDASKCCVASVPASSSLVPVVVATNSGTDVLLASVERAGAKQELVLALKPDAAGCAALKLEASSNQQRESVVLDVCVVGVDDPPTVVAKNVVNPVAMNEDDAARTFAVGGWFEDIDSADRLYDLDNGGAWESFVAAEVRNGVLSITPLPNKWGSAAMKLTCTAGGKPVTAEFTVAVAQVDDDIKVVRQIAEIFAKEDDPEKLVPVQSAASPVFRDADSAVKRVVVESVSRPDAISPSLVPGATAADLSLKIVFLKDMNTGGAAAAEIVLRAESEDGSTATATVKVNVAAVDDEPFVKKPIAAFGAKEDWSGAHEVDLSEYFGDVDGPAPRWSASISPSGVAAVALTGSGSVLSLSALKDGFGAAKVTVTCTTGARSVSQSFDVAIAPEDDAPVAVLRTCGAASAAICPIELLEDAPKFTTALGGVFADVDNAVADMTYTASVADGAPVAARVEQGNLLSLEPLLHRHGSAVVTVVARSGGQSVSAQVAVTVTPQEDPIRVGKGLAALSVLEDAPKRLIKLGGVFEDVDSSIASIAVASVSPAGILSARTERLTDPVTHAATDEWGLALEFAPDASGEVDVTLSATSADASSAVLSFKVTVDAVDDAPVVARTLAPIATTEDSADAPWEVDLAGLFTDVDGPAIVLGASTSDAKLLSVSVSAEKKLTVALVEDGFGAATVTVEGRSGPFTATASFRVTVAAVDDAPRLKRAFEPIAAEEDALPIVLNLANHFTDVDDDDAAMTFGAELSASLGAVVALERASHSPDVFLVSPRRHAHGAGEIRIRASSGGKNVSATVAVNITSVADSIRVARPLAAVAEDEDSAPLAIDLDGVFDDADAQDGVAAVAVEAVAPAGIVEASVHPRTGGGRELRLRFGADRNGRAEVTLRATSTDGSAVTTTLAVRVRPVDDPPRLNATRAAALRAAAGSAPRVCAKGSVCGWSWPDAAKNESGSAADLFYDVDSPNVTRAYSCDDPHVSVAEAAGGRRLDVTFNGDEMPNDVFKVACSATATADGNSAAAKQLFVLNVVGTGVTAATRGGNNNAQGGGDGGGSGDSFSLTSGAGIGVLMALAAALIAAVGVSVLAYRHSRRVRKKAKNTVQKAQDEISRHTAADDIEMALAPGAAVCDIDMEGVGDSPRYTGEELERLREREARLKELNQALEQDNLRMKKKVETHELRDATAAAEAAAEPVEPESPRDAWVTFNESL